GSAQARIDRREDVATLEERPSKLSTGTVQAAFTDVTSIAAVDPVVRRFFQPLADGHAAGKWRGPRKDDQPVRRGEPGARSPVVAA
ncbi:hypothetical protein MKL09_13300, partial [Methylobacterium sp. J-048]|uniref:hypothetical protein n=1 Tax=Methylobacterium sp. J-048 TaxID=2836635 RepID=UPI001FB88092